MTVQAVDQEIIRLEGEIAELKTKLAEARARRPSEDVNDYALQDASGEVRLSELFADRDELILIHNMGARCPYCTMWADGFNGLVPHLESRAAFVVVSPDPPEAQQKLREQRGWRFRMASARGTAFTLDMGFATPDGMVLPGASIFVRKDGRIQRVASTQFGPGDDYCSAWHFFALLPGGAGEWQPKLRYE